jgi:CMP-N-acetylneuraminic acid synthetase
MNPPCEGRRFESSHTDHIVVLSDELPTLNAAKPYYALVGLQRPETVLYS